MSGNENFLFQTVVLPTKSLQEIITSIATKITHLIISSSTKPEGSHSDSSHSSLSYQDLVSTSTSIVEALKNLVQVSKQTVSDNYPKDEIINEEVEVASQNLMIAAENLKLCCQVLASTNGKILSSESSFNLDLTSCICKCFQNLVVLLLCLDNAEVRHLITKANHLLKQLQILSSSDTMESLVDNFSHFANAVDKFHSRASQRCGDLLSVANHSKMLRALTTLTQSMPMLTTALSLAIKYPKNEDAISAKTFALQQIEKTVNNIVSVIKARAEDTGGPKDSEIGFFISHVRSIDDALGAENRSNLESVELETMTQALVQHVMALSAFTSKRVPVPRFSKKGNHLVKECQKLLELITAVTKLSPNQPSRFDDVTPTEDQDTSEFASVCRAIRAKLKSLQNYTLSLITSIFCHVFTITSEPLENLTKVYDCFQRNPKLDFRPRLQSALTTFQSHVEDISQVARLIQISCANPNIYRDFRPCLSNFSSVNSQIVTLCAAGSANSDYESELKDEDFMSDLQEEWMTTFKALLKCCALSLNLTHFTTEVENDIISDFEKAHEEVVNLDDMAFSKQVINATGKTKLLSTVASDVVNASYDPMYRNTVLAHIKQLNEAIVFAVGSSNLLIEDTARLSSQESYLAAASHLKTKVNQLCNALLSKPNSTPLTTEETRGLRDATDSSKITGMIREMHNLNHKLASLGFEPKTSPTQIASNTTAANKTTKSQTEIVDDMFGLSGPAVEITCPVESVPKNSVTFGTGLHPLVLSLLDECNCDGTDSNAVARSFDEIKRMTMIILEACDDTESCINATRKKIYHMDCPEFTVEQESDVDSCYSVHQGVDFWKKNLSESCNLMEGIVLDEEKKDLEFLKSLCDDWSKAYRILMGCFVSELHLHLINFRRFLNLPESSAASSDITNDTESDGSSEVIFHSRKPNGSLVEIERMSETLSILLSDVIVLYKRDLKIQQDESKTSLVTRLSVLLDRCKKISLDLKNIRKILRKLTSHTTSSLNSFNTSWLHVYCVLFASKLCALCSLIDTTLLLVLGVWKVDFPEDQIVCANSDDETLNDYQSKVCTLSQTTQGKITKALANYSLESQTVLKLNKMKSRVDVTCESIRTIIDFVKKQNSVEMLLSRHGHLVYHLVFLHHRFFLDVSRIFLVTKALLFISNSEKKDFKNDVNVSVTDLGKMEEAHSSQSVPRSTYAERLANLTKQRKEREKELLHLLTDIDLGKNPTKPTSKIMSG